MNRREFIAISGALLAKPNTGPVSLLTFAPADASAVRRAAAARSALLNRFVDPALKSGPWSVTFHRPTGNLTKAGPNDYFSEGPYWWPDPKNSNGPYIRRDGERNPDRFQANHDDLGHMSEAVLSLGIGAFFLNRPDCGRHASLILNTWFIDPKTRMNPNLEFGQAIRGVTTGRGTGLIDTVSLIRAIQGIVLLEAAGAIDPALARELRQWSATFVQWMTTSSKGLAEKRSGNNHSTWWTAQVAAHAVFTGDRALQQLAWDYYGNYLVPTEIRPDGSCPREEARTKSLSYSSMNLDAFATICRLAQVAGVDLWHFKTAQGIGVERAFHYLAPFVSHPDTWRKQQIEAYDPGSYVFPGLAGVGLSSPKLLAAYENIPRAETPWVQFIDLLVRASSSRSGVRR
ncbi:MAG: alginate lyase family protein [Acidobacteriaceae bacterium]|nr:alginate lyase family protein [Acidobacteriaceae bacterium]